MKRQPTEREKIFAGDITDKWLISKYINSSYNSISKKPNNPIKKWTKELKRHFSKEDNTDGQQAHEKMLNITNYQGNANQNQNKITSHTC